MDYATLLNELIEEEERLVFSAFDPDTAFDLGCLLRERAKAAGGAVAIEITANGRTLFFHAMPGTTADNAGWLARKRAVVERFDRSTWYMKHFYDSKGSTIEEKSFLSAREYSPFGGCFPLRVRGAGRIGTIGVSGLPQEEDHRLIVETLTAFLASAEG